MVVWGGGFHRSQLLNQFGGQPSPGRGTEGVPASGACIIAKVSSTPFHRRAAPQGGSRAGRRHSDSDLNQLCTSEGHLSLLQTNTQPGRGGYTPSTHTKRGSKPPRNIFPAPGAPHQLEVFQWPKRTHPVLCWVHSGSGPRTIQDQSCILKTHLKPPQYKYTADQFSADGDSYGVCMKNPKITI